MKGFSEVDKARTVPGAPAALTLPESCARYRFLGAPEAQLSAHHAGRHQVPVIVANRSPLSVFQHFNSSFASVGSPFQPHQWLLEDRDRSGATTVCERSSLSLQLLFKACGCRQIVAQKLLPRGTLKQPPRNTKG